MKTWRDSAVEFVILNGLCIFQMNHITVSIINHFVRLVGFFPSDYMIRVWLMPERVVRIEEIARSLTKDETKMKCTLATGEMGSASVHFLFHLSLPYP